MSADLYVPREETVFKLSSNLGTVASGYYIGLTSNHCQSLFGSKSRQSNC